MAIKRTGVELVAEGEAQFNAALKRADQSIQNFGADVTRASERVNTAGASFTKTAEKIDAAGRNARIGFSAAAQAADLFGANISGVVGPAAAAADAIGDIVGMLGSLNPIGLAISGISVAIGGLIMLMEKQKAEAAAALEATRKYEESLRQVYETAKTAINELGPKTDPLQILADSIPITIDRLRELATTSVEVQDALNRLATSMEGSRILEDRIAKLQVQMRDLNAEIERQQQLVDRNTAAGIVSAEDIARLQQLQDDLRNAENMMRVYTEALAGAKTAQEELRGSLRGMGEDAIQAADDMAILIGNLNAAAEMRRFGEDYPDAFMRTARAGKAMEDVERRGVTVANDLNAAHKKLAEDGLRKTQQAAAQVAAKFKSVIESAMNFTSVTDEDMAASAAGTYTDKWDEFLRRAKAVQSGTDPAQFGEDFKKQLEGLGMPLDEVIRKFQNFQLFVGGANFDLVNFNAFTTQIEDQLLGMAGKASLTEEAMKRVWANLSPTAKAALATTGIENAEDALKQFLDPAGQAKDEVSDLNKEINNTPTLVTTTFDVVKAPTFDPVLAQIAEDLSIIPSAADILVTIYYESRNKPPDSGGTLGDGSAVPPGYASGGAGVFGTDQLVRVHAGEGFWFSGTQWQYPIPGAFGRMVEPAAPSSVRYGDSSANINVTVNANRVASSVDVDHLANRVAESIRSQVMTRRRAGA